MNSTERVRAAILGKEYDRQPIYGWVYANLTDRITERFGSVAAFEDKYEFDAAHIFGAPCPRDKKLVERLAAENGELTPGFFENFNSVFGARDGSPAPLTSFRTIARSRILNLPSI